jgi:hypothetical protein
LEEEEEEEEEALPPAYVCHFSAENEKKIGFCMLFPCPFSISWVIPKIPSPRHCLTLRGPLFFTRRGYLPSPNPQEEDHVMP